VKIYGQDLNEDYAMKLWNGIQNDILQLSEIYPDILFSHEGNVSTTERCFFMLFTFDEDFHLSTKQEVKSCFHKLDIQCAWQDFIIRPLLKQLTADFEILKKKIFGEIETISRLDWDAACDSDKISYLDLRKLGDLQLSRLEAQYVLLLFEGRIDTIANHGKWVSVTEGEIPTVFYDCHDDAFDAAADKNPVPPMLFTAQIGTSELISLRLPAPDLSDLLLLGTGRFGHSIPFFPIEIGPRKDSLYDSCHIAYYCSTTQETEIQC
jgi:hypothetical protein